LAMKRGVLRRNHGGTILGTQKRDIDKEHSDERKRINEYATGERERKILLWERWEIMRKINQ